MINYMPGLHEFRSNDDIHLLNLFQYPERHIISFKSDYYKHGKFNLGVQVPHLVRLAEHYRNRYQQTQQWIDCLKVK